MKTLKSTNFLSLILGVICVSILFTPTIAQEYDDMYFNKSDRKKIKTENSKVVAHESKTVPLLKKLP